MTTPQTNRNIDAASLDLDAIKARAAAATDGPWEAATCHESEQKTRSEYVRSALLKPDAPASGLWMAWKPDSPLGVHLTAVTGDGPHGEADAEFIANSREDVPALVAEVERLRALTTVDDAMVERAARDIELYAPSHRPINWPEDHRELARGALKAALGGEA